MPHLDFPQSSGRGAIARRDITPPIGMYHRMWGAATHDRSTGVHRPLVATVLALEPLNASRPASGSGPGADAQLFVSLDHCLMWTEQIDCLRREVCQALALNLNQLQVTFTHTHAAGLLDPGRADLPGGELIAPYLAEMTRRIVGAGREALAAAAPLEVVYGHGRCALATNRDFWDAENGLYVCGFNPAGPSDDTLVVARISGERGATVATLINYACHPTTLAWDNTLVSPDFVGATRDVVETASGAPCLFLQGASGDLGPRHGFVGDVAAADRNGRELGYAALAALEGLPPPGVRFEYTCPVVSGATIGTWQYAPLPEQSRREKCRWRYEHFDVELPYRADLPTRDETDASLVSWRRREEAATQAGDQATARDCRAQVERMSRQVARLRSLPPGDKVSIEASLLHWGDAYWLTVQAEHYQKLQRALRERFPDCPIIVCTLTNGWSPGYLPTAETFGRGIYQESIALTAPGSLEVLIENVAARIAQGR